MKNELQTLENTFSDFIRYETLLKEYFIKYEHEAFNQFYKLINDECIRAKNAINEATQIMAQQDYIKLYISQILIRLSNLCNRINLYMGIYAINFEKKLKELELIEGSYSTEALFLIELHLDMAIKMSENRIKLLTIDLVRDYEYLFDTLEQDDQISIIINDFKKNIPPKHIARHIQKIKWEGTAAEFVEYFAKLIKTGKLSLNGVSDTDPLVKVLHSMFMVEKDRGEGEIAEGSLCTKFKEYNSTIR